MLSQLTSFSQGLLGCRKVLEREGGEENIRFPFPALDVTTLIIDLGKEQFCSFGIFLEYERLIYSLMKVAGVKKKDWKAAQSCRIVTFSGG